MSISIQINIKNMATKKKKTNTIKKKSIDVFWFFFSWNSGYVYSRLSVFILINNEVVLF